MKSKSTAKARAKAKPVIKESAGDWIFGNIWFKIGLSKTDAAILKTIGSKIFAGKVNSAVVARRLLITALAHFDKINPLMLQDAKYAALEDFRQDVYLRGLVKNQHAAFLRGGSRKKT